MGLHSLFWVGCMVIYLISLVFSASCNFCVIVGSCISTVLNYVYSALPYDAVQAGILTPVSLLKIQNPIVDFHPIRFNPGDIYCFFNKRYIRQSSSSKKLFSNNFSNVSPGFCWAYICVMPFLRMSSREIMKVVTWGLSLVLEMLPLEKNQSLML
jgi:hypothetical protein